MHKAYEFHAEIHPEGNRIVLTEREGATAERHLFGLMGAERLRDELDAAIKQALRDTTGRETQTP